MSGVAVLIVEDEEDLRNLLKHTLADAGFDVVAVGDIVGAREAIAKQPPAVVVLDRMLPDGDGLRFCDELRREKGSAAVLVLSALGTENDRVLGLESGADDYVVKPFSLRELTARVQVLAAPLGESRGAAVAAKSSTLRWRELVMDLSRHRVLVSGAEIELRPLEYRLLAELLENPTRAFGRNELLELLWGPESRPSARTVDVHVTRLRQGLGTHADAIETVPGFGYRLREA